MRDFKGMKRQRSRNRGGGGGGGNGKPQQNANRAFDSNGPEGVKVRGAAQHVYEKYQQLARDAASAGDRVLAENYLQHAEHYFRTIRTMQPNRPASDILGSRDQFVSGYDMDYEEEPSPEAAAEPYVEAQPSEGGERTEPRRDDRQGDGYRARDDRNRDDRNRDDRPRDDRSRDDRPRDEYRQRDDRNRDDRPREDRSREDRSREDRPRDDRPRDERPRDDRPREDRQRDDRPRDDRREPFNREDRPRERYSREDRPRPERDPLAVVEPQSSPLIAPEAPAEGARILRGQDGAASEAPAFLQARAPTVAAEAASDEPKRPRRRKAAAPDAESAPADEA